MWVPTKSCSGGNLTHGTFYEWGPGRQQSCDSEGNAHFTAKAVVG